MGTIRLTSGLNAPFTDEIRKTYDLDRFRGVVEEFDMAVAGRLLLRQELRGGDLALRAMAMMFA